MCDGLLYGVRVCKCGGLVVWLVSFVGEGEFDGEEEEEEKKKRKKKKKKEGEEGRGKDFWGSFV